MLPDDHADRLRSVTGRGQDLQRHLPKAEALAVVQRLDGEADIGAGPVGDDRAGLIGQLQVAADEVGVHVGLDHPLDPQPPSRGLIEIDAHIPAGIDDHRPPGGLVPDQVGRMRQAGQVMLGQDHLTHPRAAQGGIRGCRPFG